jgi:hypothetical protein
MATLNASREIGAAKNHNRLFLLRTFEFSLQLQPFSLTNTQRPKNFALQNHPPNPNLSLLIGRGTFPKKCRKEFNLISDLIQNCRHRCLLQ